jgi:hypothetical protein
MKKIYLIFSLAMSAMLVNSQSVTLTATDDTEIYGNDPASDTNPSGNNKEQLRGENTVINAWYNDGSQSRQMAFVRFDLAEIATAVGGDFSLITSAVLRLYGTMPAADKNQEPNNHSRVTKVFNMTATNPLFDWDEETFHFLAWAGDADYTTNALSGSSSAYYFQRNPDKGTGGRSEYVAAELVIDNTASIEQWFEFDITAALKAYNYGNNAFTLQICDEAPMRPTGQTTGRAWFEIHSRENESGNAPEILITFNTLAVENNSVSDLHYTVENKLINVKDLPFNTQISIADLAGRTLLRATTDGNLAYRFNSAGIYLLTVNGKTLKIAVR